VNTSASSALPAGALPAVALPAVALPAVGERDHVTGSSRPKLTLVEYGDFGCPFGAIRAGDWRSQSSAHVCPHDAFDRRAG
jgi:hypothetical protein